MTPYGPGNYDAWHTQDLEAILDFPGPSDHDKRAVFNELVRRYSEIIRQEPAGEPIYLAARRAAANQQPLAPYNSGVYVPPQPDPAAARGATASPSGCLMMLMLIFTVLAVVYPL